LFPLQDDQRLGYLLLSNSLCRTKIFFKLRAKGVVLIVIGLVLEGFFLILNIPNDLGGVKELTIYTHFLLFAFLVLHGIPHLSILAETVFSVVIFTHFLLYRSLVWHSDVSYLGVIGVAFFNLFSIHGCVVVVTLTVIVTLLGDLIKSFKMSHHLVYIFFKVVIVLNSKLQLALIGL
jgi:hypothetical protein